MLSGATTPTTQPGFHSTNGNQTSHFPASVPGTSPARLDRSTQERRLFSVIGDQIAAFSVAAPVIYGWEQIARREGSREARPTERTAASSSPCRSTAVVSSSSRRGTRARAFEVMRSGPFGSDSLEERKRCRQVGQAGAAHRRRPQVGHGDEARRPADRQHRHLCAGSAPSFAADHCPLPARGGRRGMGRRESRGGEKRHSLK